MYDLYLEIRNAILLPCHPLQKLHIFLFANVNMEIYE